MRLDRLPFVMHVNIIECSSNMFMHIKFSLREISYKKNSRTKCSFGNALVFLIFFVFFFLLSYV